MSNDTNRDSNNIFYLILAWLCIATGGLGIFLPLLPTTPFLLLAVWFASRGSPRLHDWLWQHAHFGPLLIAWRDERAIPLSAKWTGTTMLAVSWLVLAWHQIPAFGLLAAGAMFTVIGFFLWMRPSPGSPHKDSENE